SGHPSGHRQGVEHLLRLAKYGDAELGSAGVSPAVARASLRFAQGQALPTRLLGRDAPATAAGTAALHQTVSPYFASLCRTAGPAALPAVSACARFRSALG